MKKLYRNDKDKVLAGVFSGLGEYYNIDPIILRVCFMIFLLITGVFPGVIIYIVAALVIPNAPSTKDVPQTESSTETK